MNSGFLLFFRFVDVLKLLHVVSIHTVDSDNCTVSVFCVSIPSAPTVSTRAKVLWHPPHVVSGANEVLINTFNEERLQTLYHFCTKKVDQKLGRAGVRC